MRRQSSGLDDTKQAFQPSSEQSSGPAVYTQSKTESISSRHVTEGMEHENSTIKMQCPGTSASDKAWSLRRAVMNIGENHGGSGPVENELVGRGWAGSESNSGAEKIGVGYSGAWP